MKNKLLKAFGLCVFPKARYSSKRFALLQSPVWSSHDGGALCSTNMEAGKLSKHVELTSAI